MECFAFHFVYLIFYETVLENRGKRGSLDFNGRLPNSLPNLAQRQDIYICVYHMQKARSGTMLSVINWVVVVGGEAYAGNPVSVTFLL